MSIREIKDYEILKLAQSTASHEGRSIFWIITVNIEQLEGYEFLSEQALAYRFEGRDMVAYFNDEPVLVFIEDQSKGCDIKGLLDGNALMVGGLSENGEVNNGFILIPAGIDVK